MQFDPYKHKAKTVRELSYPWGWKVLGYTEEPVFPYAKSSNVNKCKDNST